MTDNTDALDAFVAAKAEIDAMLNLLERLSEDHFGVDPDAVHWGHVGSLHHVAEQLRDVCTFLMPDDTEDSQAPPEATGGRVLGGAKPPVANSLTARIAHVTS